MLKVHYFLVCSVEAQHSASQSEEVPALVCFGFFCSTSSTICTKLIFKGALSEDIQQQKKKRLQKRPHLLALLSSPLLVVKETNIH